MTRSFDMSQVVATKYNKNEMPSSLTDGNFLVWDTATNAFIEKTPAEVLEDIGGRVTTTSASDPSGGSDGDIWLKI